MIPNPVVSNPADVELASSPFPQEWVLEGRPRACAKVIARSSDHAMTVIAWSCTPGRFEWHYQVDEVAHFLSGEVFIADGSSQERRLVAGDTAFFAAGSTCVWRVTQEVRKVAVCRIPVPRLVGFALRVWNYACRLVRGQAGRNSNPLSSQAG